MSRGELNARLRALRAIEEAEWRREGFFASPRTEGALIWMVATGLMTAFALQLLAAIEPMVDLSYWNLLRLLIEVAVVLATMLTTYGVVQRRSGRPATWDGYLLRLVAMYIPALPEQYRLLRCGALEHGRLNGAQLHSWIAAERAAIQEVLDAVDTLDNRWKTN